MLKLTSKQNCCGCTACASICPKGCIAMTPDSEGFCYPQIDEANCINCALTAGCAKKFARFCINRRSTKC